MRQATVLIIDDSAAMRALFCDILEQCRDVCVVGTAANADEAREQIARLKPNVLTLDVEMPGTSGIEFLEEIMTTNPMPVVMLSSLTQHGAETSLRAYELGAVECFPKPVKATPEQFSKAVSKLGKIVLTAANSNVQDISRRRRQATRPDKYEWNGHIVALSVSMGGVDAMTQLLGHFPRHCPPTVINLHAELTMAETLVKHLDGNLPCSVRLARDGGELAPGVVHVMADPARHIVFENGHPAHVRLIERDEVDGVRPSANLLFGTIARSGVPAVGAVLSGMGDDGARGLRMMRDAGCRTFAQERASAVVAEAPASALALDAAERELAVELLAEEILACCSLS